MKHRAEQLTCHINDQNDEITHAFFHVCRFTRREKNEKNGWFALPTNSNAFRNHKKTQNGMVLHILRVDFKYVKLGAHMLTKTPLLFAHASSLTLQLLHPHARPRQTRVNHLQQNHHPLSILTQTSKSIPQRANTASQETPPHP